MYEILTNRSVVEISGEDALKFLQNLITNDIKVTDYCYTYMLNNQGRYLFDFFILTISKEQFLIDIHSNQIEIFKSHLLMYKLRAKIEVKDVSDTYRIVYSHHQPDFLYLSARKDPRCNLLGFRSIVRVEVLAKSQEIDIEEKNLYLQDKYKFVIVDGDEDLIYNKSIPVSYGAEELNSISYNKGCYIGQEVISRVKYQGVVRKKIFNLSSDVNLSFLEKNDEITFNDSKIGVVCSSYKKHAIALIREEQYLALPEKIAIAGGVSVFLSIPPWRV